MKQRRQRWTGAVALLAAFATLAACGDDADDASSGPDPRDEIGPVPEPGAGADVLPRTGLWTYGEDPIENNTCGEWAITDGNTLFRILSSAGTSFVVEQEEAENFVCNVTGTTFLCAERLRVERAVERTNVTLRAAVSIDGTLQSPESLDGVQRVEVTCRGSQCALAPRVLGIELPCTYDVPFRARATGF
jgi:hypothetical protein